MFGLGCSTRLSWANPQNEKAAILLSAVDLTERENAEAARDRLFLLERQARALAEASSRSKDQFIATLSHELRTPLNAIVGWTTLVRHSLTESELVSQGREIIERNARIQTELIADLLDLSRIVSGMYGSTWFPVDLIVVLSHVIQSMQPAALERQLDLRSYLESGRFRGSGCFLDLLAFKAESRVPAPEGVLPLQRKGFTSSSGCSGQFPVLSRLGNQIPVTAED